MPRLLFHPRADGHIEIEHNVASLQAAASLPAASHEGGFVAVDHNAPGGRLDRRDGMIMWLCVAALSAVSAYFAFRCFEFFQG